MPWNVSHTLSGVHMRVSRKQFRSIFPVISKRKLLPDFNIKYAELIKHPQIPRNRGRGQVKAMAYSIVKGGMYSPDVMHRLFCSFKIEENCTVPHSNPFSTSHNRLIDGKWKAVHFPHLTVEKCRTWKPLLKRKMHRIILINPLKLYNFRALCFRMIWGYMCICIADLYVYVHAYVPPHDLQGRQPYVCTCFLGRVYVWVGLTWITINVDLALTIN